jgi:hypothetical protein
MLLLSLGVLQRKMVDTASLQATDPTARKTGRLHYRGDNRALGLAQEGKSRGLLARHGGSLELPVERTTLLRLRFQ